MLIRFSFNPAASVALLSLLLLSGCAPPLTEKKTERSPAADITPLLDLMRQRLLAMHDVARWKWNSRVPLTDPVREQAILDDIVTQSKQHNLDAAFVRAFFVAQFDAAKRLQEDDLRQWHAEQHPPFADVPDLVIQLRPKIDNLNGQLLPALATVKPLLSSAEVRGKLQQRAAELLNGNGITRDVRDAAIAPLMEPVR